MPLESQSHTLIESNVLLLTFARGLDAINILLGFDLGVLGGLCAGHAALGHVGHLLDHLKLNSLER